MSHTCTFIIRIRYWPLTSSLCVRHITSVCFDISIPYWAWFEHILMYIIQMVRTQVLTTYEVFTTSHNHIEHMGLSAWGNSCVDLWPQGQIYWVFDMALCLGHISCTWVHHHKIMCHIHSWPLHDLDLWLQYQNYICFWTRSFLDWCRHIKFSTRVLHH